MSRPLLEVADLIRAAGAAFIERNRSRIRWSQVKAMLAIVPCRTAALGGHVDECTRCGYRVAISYNSCRNRHSPKCQTAAQERWIARRRELLPTRYMDVVFTLPHRLAPLVLQNKKVIDDLLFRTSAETLLERLTKNTLPPPKTLQTFTPALNVVDDEGHRAAHHCRNPTSLSTSDQRGGMKRISPIHKLRVLPRASHFSASTPDGSLLSACATPLSAALFLSSPLFQRMSSSAALRGTTSAHLHAVPSHN